MGDRHHLFENGNRVGLPRGSAELVQPQSGGLESRFIVGNRVGSPGLAERDRGCQYTSEAYQRTLQSLGIECSMSRTGCCYDNAVMERFFWSLKHEWTNRQEYADEATARLSVFKYIEKFYNRERLHQALDYQSPDQFEAVNAPAAAA